jgi:hypothetical protein
MADEEDTGSPPEVTAEPIGNLPVKTFGQGLTDVLPHILQQRLEDLANTTAVAILVGLIHDGRNASQEANAELATLRKTITDLRDDLHSTRIDLLGQIHTKDTEVVQLKEKLEAVSHKLRQNSVMMLLAGTCYAVPFSLSDNVAKFGFFIVGTVLLGLCLLPRTPRDHGK